MELEEFKNRRNDYWWLTYQTILDWQWLWMAYRWKNLAENLMEDSVVKLTVVLLFHAGSWCL